MPALEAPVIRRHVLQKRSFKDERQPSLDEVWNSRLLMRFYDDRTHLLYVYVRAQYDYYKHTSKIMIIPPVVDSC